MASISREDLLSAYAAGTTSPGLSLLCAAHLTLSPDARAFVATAEAVGGEMLSHEPTTDVAPLCFDALLARLDEEAPPPAPANHPEPTDDPALPLPIWRALGEKTVVPWRLRLPGLHEHLLDGFELERVSLLKARPGSKIPQHTHEGDEATLVLSGVLQDGGDVFEKGDIALSGTEDDHSPVILGDDLCVCLVVNNGALRFTGRFGRALNLFAE